MARLAPTPRVLQPHVQAEHVVQRWQPLLAGFIKQRQHCSQAGVCSSCGTTAVVSPGTGPAAAAAVIERTPVASVNKDLPDTHAALLKELKTKNDPRLRAAVLCSEASPEPAAATLGSLLLLLQQVLEAAAAEWPQDKQIPQSPPPWALSAANLLPEVDAAAPHLGAWQLVKLVAPSWWMWVPARNRDSSSLGRRTMPHHLSTITSRRAVDLRDDPLLRWALGLPPLSGAAAGATAAATGSVLAPTDTQQQEQQEAVQDDTGTYAQQLEASHRYVQQQLLCDYLQQVCYMPWSSSSTVLSVNGRHHQLPHTHLLKVRALLEDLSAVQSPLLATAQVAKCLIRYYERAEAVEQLLDIARHCPPMLEAVVKAAAAESSNREPHPLLLQLVQVCTSSGMLDPVITGLSADMLDTIWERIQDHPEVAFQLGGMLALAAPEHPFIQHLPLQLRGLVGKTYHGSTVKVKPEQVYDFLCNLLLVLPPAQAHKVLKEALGMLAGKCTQAQLWQLYERLCKLQQQQQQASPDQQLPELQLFPGPVAALVVAPKQPAWNAGPAAQVLQVWRQLMPASGTSNRRRAANKRKQAATSGQLKQAKHLPLRALQRVAGALARLGHHQELLHLVQACPDLLPYATQLWRGQLLHASASIAGAAPTKRRSSRPTTGANKDAASSSSESAADAGSVSDVSAQGDPSSQLDIHQQQQPASGQAGQQQQQEQQLSSSTLQAIVQKLSSQQPVNIEQLVAAAAAPAKGVRVQGSPPDGALLAQLLEWVGSEAPNRSRPWWQEGAGHMLQLLAAVHGAATIQAALKG